MLPSEEYTEVEGRAYVNPQVSLDETTDFIQNLRDTQGQNTQQIISDTRALGTEVPSSLGGLTGAESYFTSRYQTPQTAALVADLRSTAQAKALNDALANEQAMWKKRYNDAYRAYQKRAASGGGGNSSGSGGGNTSTWDGEPELKATDTEDNDKTTSGSSFTPPNPYSDEFNITGEEQTKRISERSGLPEWLANILKVVTNP